MSDAVLVENGIPRGAIHLSAAANDVRMWLARLDGDEAAAAERLERCRAACERADRGARGVAGQMIAYADDKTGRHLLFRFNQNVIASIEAGRSFVEGMAER